MGMPQLGKRQLWNCEGKPCHPGQNPGSSLKDEIAKEYLLSREIILKAYFPQTQQMYSQVCTL